MPAPEARLTLGGCDLVVLGTIAGFGPDGARVEEALHRHQPALIALGIPPDDLPALEALAKDPESFKQMEPPDDMTGRRLELLKRFGAIQIPSPDLQAAYAAATAYQTRIEAIDLDDQAYTREYTQRMKLRHVIQANGKRKRLLAMEFKDAHDAYDLEQKWDSAVNGLRPLREVERLREGHMAARIRSLVASAPRALAVVPAARFAGVVADLAHAPDAKANDLSSSPDG